jgi:hypothetical protein
MYNYNYFIKKIIYLNDTKKLFHNKCKFYFITTFMPHQLFVVTLK